MSNVDHKVKTKIAILLLLLPVCYFICLATGEIHLNISEIINGIFLQKITSDSHQILLYEFRIPEALTSIIACIALSTSGIIMQSYFRNPLAGPSVLGVTSGSSFGIVLLLICFPQLLNNSVETKFYMILFSSLGALVVLFFLGILQLRIRSIETLIIAGVLIGYFVSASETMLLSNTNAQTIKTFFHWGFGNFSKTNYNDILIMLSICSILIFITLTLSKKLDAFQFSDETILNSGFNKYKTGYVLTAVSGILCAVVTSFCGPIAFIGLCVPHIARMYFNTTRHFYLITGGALIAANLGLICTAITRLSFFGNSLPINSVTAFLGAPFILYIFIITRKKRVA